MKLNTKGAFQIKDKNQLYSSLNLNVNTGKPNKINRESHGINIHYYYIIDVSEKSILRYCDLKLIN